MFYVIFSSLFFGKYVGFFWCILLYVAILHIVIVSHSIIISDTAKQILHFPRDSRGKGRIEK